MTPDPETPGISEKKTKQTTRPTRQGGDAAGARPLLPLEAQEHALTRSSSITKVAL